MEPGQKYLSVKILGNIKLNAYPNTEARKHNDKAPHFKGEGIAVWINTVKEKKEPIDHLDEALL